MAYSLSFKDGSSTLDLAGTLYALLPGGLATPTPRERQAWAGQNLFRHGADLVEEFYDNRTVTARLKVVGTSMDGLRSALQDLVALTRRASEYSAHGLGTAVTLEYQLDGASATHIFDVLTGRVDLPPEWWTRQVLDKFIVQPVTLTLTCKPFARGAQESAQNYLDDPSFEIAGSALADWTAVAGTGTSERDGTGSAKYGTASLLITRTGGTASVGRRQLTTAFGSGSILSAYTWVLPSALGSGVNAQLLLEYLDSTGGALSTATANLATTGTAYVRVDLLNQTVPSAVGTVRYAVLLAGGTGTGTARFDGCFLGSGSAVPTAWISGRSVANHYDDAGQAHINYVDLLNVPGDVPAALKVYADEQQAGTRLYMGVRHAGEHDDAPLVFEGELFTGSGTAGTAWTVGTSGTASNGTYGRWDDTLNNVATTPATASILTYTTAIPDGQYRVLMQVAHNSGIEAFWALGYSYGGITVTPTATADFSTGTSALAWLRRDVGVLTVPPFNVPSGDTAPSMTLRVALYGASTSAKGFLDYVMLIPINRDSVFGTKASAQQQWLIDSVSARPGVWVLNRVGSGTVQSIPEWLGTPPHAHPRGNRYYFVSNHINDHKVNVRVTYEPHYLVVR